MLSAVVISTALGAVLFILGIVLICKGIAWDKARGRPRCAKCWYLLIGLPEIRCPECGWRPKHERDVFKTRRSWRVAFVGVLLCVLPVAHQIHRHWTQVLHVVLPKWKLEDEVASGDFLIRRYSDRWDGYPEQVRIWQGSQQVLIMSGWSLSLGGEARKTKRIIGLGDDITGEGVPDLIIQEYSGGAHCCSTQYWFELNEETGVLPLGKLEGLHCDFVFDDIDRDGCWEAIGWDWMFAYWNTCFAGSPAPEVVMRYYMGRFVVATDLMRKPPPGEGDLAEKIRRVRLAPEDGDWESSIPPVDYWTVLLDLLYTGNVETAEYFAEAAWASDTLSRRKFLGGFYQQLTESPYWPELRSLTAGFGPFPPVPDAGESLISTAPCLGTVAE